MLAEERATATDIRRHRDLRIPVRGDSVGAMRYEPVGVEGARPTILMYVPYPKDDMITYGAYDQFNRYLAHHGYEVVVADMVGSGSSEGFVEELFLRAEGKEGAAIVEWLADQDWSNGRVGMYGKSYGGITALDAAAQRPDPLEAIVPIHTPYQGFRNAYTYGGLFELLTIGMDWLSLMQVLELKPQTIRERDDWVDVWTTRLENLRDRDPWLVKFLRHRPEDDWWADKDIPVENIDVPTLAVGGWRDPYTQDTVEYFEAIDAPKRLLFGPWRHQMPHLGLETQIDFRRQVRDWFDRYLLEDAPEGETTTEIRFWTETDGGGKVDGGVWRETSRWPTMDDPDGETVSFAVTPDGLEPAEAYTDGSVDRTDEVDYTVGIESTDPYGAGLPAQDTNGDDARSLTFESAPLDNPVDLTGTGEVTLRIEADDPDPTVSVRVLDVSPDGTATLVTHATSRLQTHTGTRNPRPIESGREYDVSLPLEPKSHLFEPGHRIRIAIAGSYFPEVMPTGAATELTVRSSPDSPTALRFPGSVRDSLSFADSIEMAKPAADFPLESEWDVSTDANWTTSRDRSTGRASVRKQNRFEVDLPHVTFTRDGDFRASIGRSDPDSLTVQNDLEMALSTAAHDIRLVATNQFDRDLAQVTSRVVLDGETIFEERWLD